MAEKTRAKKRSKKKRPGKKRTERRFLPEGTQTSRASLIAGGVGSVALGAGVYAQWIRDPPHEYGAYIVAGGALVLAAALWFGESTSHPVRVGDGGIAIERGSELSRLLWCDIERITIEKNNLLARGDGLVLSVPLTGHATAVAWILKEGVRRVPDVLDVKRGEADRLPTPKEADGEVLPLASVQVTGRECAASGETISFDREARLCPTCGQVYQKDHVPKTCVTCGDDIAGRAMRP